MAYAGDRKGEHPRAHLKDFAASSMPMAIPASTSCSPAATSSRPVGGHMCSTGPSLASALRGQERGLGRLVCGDAKSKAADSMKPGNAPNSGDVRLNDGQKKVRGALDSVSATLSFFLWRPP